MPSWSSSVLATDHHLDDKTAHAFVNDFINSSAPKFIFGRNEYSKSLASHVHVDGFIDEFTQEKEYLGKPIVQLGKIPTNSMIVSVVSILPLSVKRRLNKLGYRNLDYFRFRKYSQLDIAQVDFHWSDSFMDEFMNNALNYDWIYNKLYDEESKKVMTKIINFRLSSDLNHMTGFVNGLERQYFEEFLNLKPHNEVFVDVGCFDGFTTLEFIKRCPFYEKIYVFEPETHNMNVVKENLNGYPKIQFYDFGLSNQSQRLRLKSDGSASKICPEGEIAINVHRLDDIIHSPVTFIKMDIEGGELLALEGAKQTIANYSPRLAISVYHRLDDFWKIPQLILSCRNDYRIFLRHYTEGVTETVMFFITDQSF